MMIPFRPIPLLALSLLLTAIPAALLAAPPGHGGRPGGPGRGFMAEHMADRLELTDEQREQIRAIHQAHGDETAPLMEALSAARRELDDAIHAELFDEALIRAAAGSVAEAEADLAVRRAQITGDVRQVLTPDQYQKARDMRAMFQEIAGELHERGRGHRHHPRSSEGD